MLQENKIENTCLREKYEIYCTVQKLNSQIKFKSCYGKRKVILKVDRNVKQF